MSGAIRVPVWPTWSVWGRQPRLVMTLEMAAGVDLTRAFGRRSSPRFIRPDDIHFKSDAELGSVPMMLVSNYPEAQQQAVASGALPGFGKNALGRPETMTALRAALEPAAHA